LYPKSGLNDSLAYACKLNRMVVSHQTAQVEKQRNKIYPRPQKNNCQNAQYWIGNHYAGPDQFEIVDQAISHWIVGGPIGQLGYVVG